VHSACYATLGSVGYAVTGVVDSCFSAALPPVNGTQSGFDTEQTMLLNVAFVLTGVVTGLAAGLIPDRPTPSAWAVRTLFVTGAGALLAIQVLLLVASEGGLTKATLYPILVGLMMLSGAGTLGFTSVGMRVAARLSHPAEEVYSGSVIEFFLLGLSASLGLLTYVVPPKYTFWFFATPALLATLSIFCCARFHAHTDMLQGLLATPGGADAASRT
jgi:hypothetical protein